MKRLISFNRRYLGRYGPERRTYQLVSLLSKQVIIQH